jgi:hypothetical protein
VRASLVPPSTPTDSAAIPLLKNDSILLLSPTEGTPRTLLYGCARFAVDGLQERTLGRPPRCAPEERCAAGDLVSHQQLRWLPVERDGTVTVLDALSDLCVRHGAPLVSKCDNEPQCRAGVTSPARLVDSGLLFASGTMPRTTAPVRAPTGRLGNCRRTWPTMRTGPASGRATTFCSRT